MNNKQSVVVYICPEMGNELFFENEMVPEFVRGRSLFATGSVQQYSQICCARAHGHGKRATKMKNGGAYIYIYYIS